MPNGSINYNLLDDRELLMLMAGHNEQAFRAIYDKYVDILYRCAYKRLPENHLAEDIVQEVFIVLYRKRADLTQVDNLEKYLLGCLQKFILQKVRNFLLHESHHLKIRSRLPQMELQQDLYDYKLLETRFHEALNRLTERTRQIFIMKRIEKMTNKQIAERLGISVNAVEKHMGKALHALKDEFREEDILMILCLFGTGLVNS